MARTKTATNGKKSVDQATQAKIEEALKEAESTPATEEKQESPKEAKKQKGELAKGSDRLDEKLGSAAKQFLEIDKKAQQVNIQSGLKEGMSEVSQWRKAKQLGTLIAMGKARSEDVQQFSEQLEKLREYSDSQIGDQVSDILEKLEDDSDPLEQLEKLSQGILEKPKQKSKEAFSILGSVSNSD